MGNAAGVSSQASMYGSGASAIQGVGSLASAYAESESLKAQGDYQRAVSQMNAEIAEDQAQDATKRGESAVRDLERDTKQKIGAQRAALAASGVKVDSGSAAQIQQDTELLAVEDARTLRNNAVREAWGFKSQAVNMRSQGNFASLAARNQASNTLLAGGMRAVGNFSDAYGRYQDSKPIKKKG